MPELDCGCLVDESIEVIGLTNGCEVCRDCFEAGADESNTSSKKELEVICNHESITTPEGHGAYCKHCGETLA